MSELQDDVDELQSEEAGSEDVEVNRDLFKDEHGFPVAFFLHRSIKKSFSRRNLTRDIKRHGGIVLDTDIGSDTVLVDALYDRRETLQIAYNTDNDRRLRKIFVELAPFVQHCIRHNFFVHRIPALKGMGGVVGRTRVPFTEQDDECLAHYIARILPDKAAGGRLGLEVYKELVGTAAVRPTHAWGARHTAESWKERYKKNAAKFDKWIENIVKREGRSRKQLWPEDRRASQRSLRGKHKYEPEEDSSEEDLNEEDTSEENYEEERPQPSGKRRRADSSPPPNKRRVVQRLSVRKGKARAEEEEEDLNEPDRLDYMNQDEITEPGPSGSRRYLEATAVAADDLTHRTQPNTASFFTQETIVASAPSGRSVQAKEASHLSDQTAESSSPDPPSIRVTSGAKQASLSGRELSAVIDPISSPSGSTDRNSPVIQPSPTRSPTRTLVNPPQIQEARHSADNRPRMAARRPRGMIEAVVVDAPYRNTRSRSQSVEPSTLDSPVRRSKKREAKGKQKAMPVLATVDEIQDNEGQGSENVEVTDESVSLLAGEIFADEIDVEHMLITDQGKELDDVHEGRGESLETDDAQTEQNLRPTQPPRKAFGLLQGRHPSDILKEFQEHSVVWTPVPRPQLPRRPAVPVRNTQEIPPPSLSRNVAVTYKAAEPPRTPLKRPRNNSASSTDLFPVSGTRASALKNKLQQQEKRSPYNPPNGTRAAKFARSSR